MTTTPDFSEPDFIEEPEATEQPTIAALVGQLIDDSRTFATAEIAYIKAQADERASYALPGLAMIGVAVALSFGIIVALPIAMMLWLATVMALGWAALIVTLVAVLICYILIRAGVARLRGSLKSRDAR
jgi:VIT1/CCC1 family predicted Fe2+/Mn2+ transporter